jgi:hypothetical protein
VAGDGVTEQPFGQWCIVEQLGHRRLAGYVTEVQLAGAGFLRVDEPPSEHGPGRTQYLAPGSLFAVHPCDEATAHLVAESSRSVPVQPWELPHRPALVPVDESVEDGW